MTRSKIRTAAAVAIVVGGLGAAVTATAAPASAGGGCRGTPVTDATGTAVTIQDFCFGPTVLRIQPGQTVTWTNADPAAHVVAGANASWGSYDDILTAHSVSYRFVKSGVYPYVCILHPGMVGAVIVGDAKGPGAAAFSSVQAVAAPLASPAAGSAPAAPPLVVTKTTGGVWRVAAIVGFALFLGTGLALALQRVQLARTRSRATAA